MINDEYPHAAVCNESQVFVEDNNNDITVNNQSNPELYVDNDDSTATD
jgi:hypothetical protein